ncbi:DUF305 domain-containing protein [Nitriliruptoraceae bacterium ZYF776]|nr:DUF305 domain-containing protein [Profundirhabdus halotolerans]
MRPVPLEGPAVGTLPPCDALWRSSLRAPRHLVASLAALTAAAVLAGCSGDEDPAESAAPDQPTIVQPGAPGEPSQILDPDDLPEFEEIEHTEADVRFMQGMIPHHVQALRMTRLVPDRTASEDIPLFAERMDISQEDEIRLMQTWLENRGEEVPALSADHDHGDGDPMGGMNDGELMPGMLTEEELLELEAAEGEEFDILFLQAMVRHHQGALQMVQELFAADGGQETEIFQFASHVESDQQIEITRMISMLEERGVSAE